MHFEYQKETKKDKILKYTQRIRDPLKKRFEKHYKHNF